jgi:hypothetical protein
MKRYLLDTNLVSAYLLGSAFAVGLMTPWIQRDEAATSVRVYAEVNEYITVGAATMPDAPRSGRSVAKTTAPTWTGW